MAGEYSTSTYNDLLRQIVADGVLEAKPFAALCQKIFSVDTKHKLGQTFEQLIRLQEPAGFNFGGTDPTFNASLTAKAGVSDRAVLKACEFVLSEVIPYALLQRGGSTKQAVQESLEHFVSGVTSSAKTVLEVSSLHGQRGLAEVASAVADGADAATITVDRYSPALISWLEGKKVDILTSAKTALTDASATGLLVDAVNPEASATTATIHVAGTGIGTNVAAIADGDWIFLSGVLSGGAVTTEQQGLMLQVERTTGTDFGINRATYVGFRGQTYAASAALSETVVMNAVARAQNRGFAAGKMVFLASPTKWAAFNASLSGKRSFDSSYNKKAQLGHGGIMVTNGSVEVECYAHPFMFTTEALLVPAEAISYKTSLDKNLISLLPPGREMELVNVPRSNGAELQAYADCQIFDESPNHSVVVTSIS